MIQNQMRRKLPLPTLSVIFSLSIGLTWPLSANANMVDNWSLGQWLGWVACPVVGLIWGAIHWMILWSEGKQSSVWPYRKSIFWLIAAFPLFQNAFAVRTDLHGQAGMLVWLFCYELFAIYIVGMTWLRARCPANTPQSTLTGLSLARLIPYAVWLYVQFPPALFVAFMS